MMASFFRTLRGVSLLLGSSVALVVSMYFCGNLIAYNPYIGFPVLFIVVAVGATAVIEVLER